jgi:hypothetical protein
VSLLELFLGSLGHARSAQQSIGNSVASARSAHLNLESSSGKNMPGGHTRGIHRLKRSLKVVEHLRGETVQRNHRETELRTL